MLVQSRPSTVFLQFDWLSLIQKQVQFIIGKWERPKKGGKNMFCR